MFVARLAVLLLACGQTGALYQPNQVTPASNPQAPSDASEGKVSSAIESSANGAAVPANEAAVDSEQDHPDEL